MGRFLKKKISCTMRCPGKKVSFHSPFQLFLLPKNELTKTSINTINFQGKKKSHIHVGNTVGINTCRLFIHLRLIFFIAFRGESSEMCD